MRPFASAPFRWLWVSTLASAAASGMLRTATAWLALEAGGGGFGVGLVLAAGMLPNLLFGLAAGTFADRSERTRQLLAVSLAALPLMVALNRVAASGSVPFWQIGVLSFGTGCLSVFDNPARQALVVDVVPRDLAPNAMGLNALALRLFTALGAFAAGVLIPPLGVPGCYALVGALYLVSAGLILRIRPPETTRPRSRERPTFVHALGEAARLIVDVPNVRTIIAAGVACEIFGFSFMTAVPVVARDVLGSGAEALGTLNAGASIGGTISVVLLSLVPGRVRREPLMSAVFVAYGAALIALAAAGTLVSAAAVMVVVGACAAAFDLLEQTLLQLAVPEEQRGRAVGIWVLGIGSAPLGHVEMGALVATLGAPTALIVNGGLVLAAAMALLARAPLFRWARRPATA